MELIAIGTSRFLMGFALAGVRTILANNKNVVATVTASEAGIVILESALLDGLTYAEREKLETSLAPVVITLSDDGFEEQDRLRHMIKNTLGVDLFK